MEGFGGGKMLFGEIEAVQVSAVEKVWSSPDNKGATFYKPLQIPEGFFILGHHGCPNAQQPLNSPFLLISTTKDRSGGIISASPPLEEPSDYDLVWSSNEGQAYFWAPEAPEGYKALGCVVTNTPAKPTTKDLVMCVRSDLTDTCQIEEPIWSNNSFSAWNVRPKVRGTKAAGAYVGAFYCQTDELTLTPNDPLPIACLKNSNLEEFSAMPNVEQSNELVQKYGPTVFFHPDEKYMPSSVNWFFQNGALLYNKDSDFPQPIEANGTNLPQGGDPNDGRYWMDLPKDGTAASRVKQGDLQSAEVYVHIKPMLGGTCSDIAMWLFYPFNGPRTLKVEVLNFTLGKIGEHVGDWEHFTLRINNLTGKLWKVYLSQHSSGQWLDTSELEYIEGGTDRAVIYSSKYGHANYPKEGDFLEGDTELQIGLRNDTKRSKSFLDSSMRFETISAQYMLPQPPQEPPWLQYMRDWGPTVVYDTRAELDKALKILPSILRHSVEDFLSKEIPEELYGEKGPNGPKVKESWEGDEQENE